MVPQELSPLVVLHGSVFEENPLSWGLSSSTIHGAAMMQENDSSTDRVLEKSRPEDTTMRVEVNSDQNTEDLNPVAQQVAVGSKKYFILFW